MKIKDVLVEAPAQDPAALKAKQARTAAFNKSKQAAQQPATDAQQTTAQQTVQPVQPVASTTAQQQAPQQQQPNTAQQSTGSFTGSAVKGVVGGAVDALAPGMSGDMAKLAADAKMQKGYNDIRQTDAYKQAAGKTAKPAQDGYWDHGTWVKGTPAQPAQPADQAQPTAGQTQSVDQAQADQAQEQPAQAAPSADTKIFSDPNTFKAEWDKYVASKSATAPYQLISDPAMLQVLKSMWMRMGGTKVESKKIKGRAI